MQGMTINGYTLQRLLGKGGMAEVWYAENTIRKKAAVKIMLPMFCGDQAVVNRFMDEAKVMVELDHPNIRKVYDFGNIDGRPAIVMEYLEGDDLKAKMKKGVRFSEQQLEKWWNQMVSALNYTHKKDVVHRDIKPSNIFVDTEDNVRLMDFGIAKIKEGASSTTTGRAMGTLIYMSPEQVDDSKRVDYRTDVYSLAVTFLNLLTGKQPYDTSTCSDYQICKSIVETPLDLSALPSSWRKQLQPYLAKKRELRPNLVNFRAQTVGVDGEGVVADGNLHWESNKFSQHTSANNADGTIVDESNIKSKSGNENVNGNSNSSDSTNYRDTIELNQSNGDYREAYNLCLQLVHEGKNDRWVQDKIKELIPLMKQKRKKEDRKSVLWAFIISIIGIIIMFIYALI